MYDMAMKGGRKELAIIAAISLIAALRVFIFSAAFPFFNNVDEHAHVDLVRKYARGYWPRQASETYDESSGRLFALFGTYEYMMPPERFPEGAAPPPPWKRDPESAREAARLEARNWARMENFEAHAPPVYYAVAGGWYRLLGHAGLTSGNQLYFLRFMSVPLIAILIWLAYWFCLSGYPERKELRLGVPMLLAFLPQDLFYTVNSDLLSAPLFTLSLILLLLWHRKEGGAWLGVLGGLLVALTILVKYTNAALPAIFGLLLLMKLFRVLKGGGWRAALRAVTPAFFTALLPVALWLARNRSLFGDLFGTEAKVEHLGWTLRPLGSFLSHPIFTPGGLWTFWDGLMATFWRGELVWHMQPIAHGAVDSFYSISAALLLSVSAIFLVINRGKSGQPAVIGSVWLAVLLSCACLALLSIAFDFGGCFYPSQEHPFFTSGRLISGMLVPFLVLYLDGAACLLRPLSRLSGTMILVAMICLMMLVSEIMLTMPIFTNPYNWFHLI
jgi:hypothetical protein